MIRSKNEREVPFILHLKLKLDNMNTNHHKLGEYEMNNTSEKKSRNSNRILYIF